MITSARTRIIALTLAAATVAGPLAAPSGSPVGAPARVYATPTSVDTGGSLGTIGIALTDAPASAADDPRAHRYIVGHLGAGERLTRRLTISNDTNSPKRLHVYAGPARVHGGRFLPADPGAASALTSWITVDTPVVDVPAGGSTVVTATVAAPSGAPSQEHYGVIWASHTSAAPTAGGPQAGLDLINRVGVRVYLSTGGTRPEAPDFQIGDLRPIRDALGVAAIVATVVNVGGRAVDLAGALTLTDGPGGLAAPPVPAEPVTLAPGETAEVPFRFPPDAELPPGQWRASVDLASGSVRREAEQTVGLESHHVASDPSADHAASSLSARQVLLPVALLVAMVLLIGAWRAARRRNP
ncbi:hypothetical protein NGF75_08430 [Dietzia kunjamensis]|uniref:hypothetical protein n=1 Tax=Dietzia kunjamensis TaxID=322509 RepID=UPI002DBCB307|nr:hypothetical protein [Dietzia kunjamensis]MEB8326012.1 hypothetical protein [Dietzia kunjamensis]